MTKDKTKALKFVMKIFLIIFFTSCNSPKSNPQLCESSSSDAFEMFKVNLQNKDFLKAKEIFVINRSEVFEKYIDTIFNIIKNPTIEFIPEENDGAYGIKKNGGNEMFYTYLKENNKTHSIIAIIFSKHINCYKISNIIKVGNANNKDKVEVQENMSFENWYEGGNLHKSDGTEWKKASEHNKLATCADFTMTISQRNGETPSVFSSKFKKASESLKNCIDKFYELPGSENTTVTKATIGCLSN